MYQYFTCVSLKEQGHRDMTCLTQIHGEEIQSQRLVTDPEQGLAHFYFH